MRRRYSELRMTSHDGVSSQFNQKSQRTGLMQTNATSFLTPSGMLDIGGLMSSFNIKNVLVLMRALRTQVQEKIDRGDFVNASPERAQVYKNAIDNVTKAIELIPDAISHLTGTPLDQGGGSNDGMGIFDLAKKGIRASSIDMGYLRGDVDFVINIFRSSFTSLDEVSKGEGLIAMLDILKHLLNDVEMEADLAQRIVKEGVRALFSYKDEGESAKELQQPGINGGNNVVRHTHMTNPNKIIPNF